MEAGWFLSFDDKSKRYKVKINKIQECDTYQIKKEELSGNIGNISTSAQWHR